MNQNQVPQGNKRLIIDYQYQICWSGGTLPATLTIDETDVRFNDTHRKAIDDGINFLGKYTKQKIDRITSVRVVEN